MRSRCKSVEVLEPTLERNDMTEKGVTDLDLLVKNWAVSIADKLGIKNAKKARIQVVWDHVTFTPQRTDWQARPGVPQPPSRTIYSSSFLNNTAEQAEHSLKVERASSALCKTNITSGYSTSYDLGLSLSLPYEVASATASFGRSVEVSKAEETSKEHVQSWSVDTSIPSPPHTLTRAKMEVKETRWLGDFILQVAIKGKILVNFYDQNTPGNHLGTIDEDVVNLLPKWGAERQGNKVLWTLRGTCDFEFGVEQMISVEHEQVTGFY